MLQMISTNDHCTVGVMLNFKVNEDATYYHTVWLYKDTHSEEFKNALTEADFSSCFKAY